jgi:hypothetical protein
VLKVVERAWKCLPLRVALGVIDLSAARYNSWRRAQVRGVAASGVGPELRTQGQPLPEGFIPSHPFVIRTSGRLGAGCARSLLRKIRHRPEPFSSRTLKFPCPGRPLSEHSGFTQHSSSSGRCSTSSPTSPVPPSPAILATSHRLARQSTGEAARSRKRQDMESAPTSAYISFRQT